MRRDSIDLSAIVPHDRTPVPDPFKKIVAGTALTRPVLMDAKCCAVFLGVSVRTWYRIANRKDGPKPVKVGRLTRWRVADLESFIENLPKSTSGSSGLEEAEE